MQVCVFSNGDGIVVLFVEHALPFVEFELTLLNKSVHVELNLWSDFLFVYRTEPDYPFSGKRNLILFSEN